MTEGRNINLIYVCGVGRYLSKWSPSLQQLRSRAVGLNTVLCEPVSSQRAVQEITGRERIFDKDWIKKLTWWQKLKMKFKKTHYFISCDPAVPGGDYSMKYKKDGDKIIVESFDKIGGE